MLNNFVPYPRYERAVFIGDTATEYLAALKIYAYALVGGEVPSMELLHPQEKPLGLRHAQQTAGFKKRTYQNPCGLCAP